MNAQREILWGDGDVWCRVVGVGSNAALAGITEEPDAFGPVIRAQSAFHTNADERG